MTAVSNSITHVSYNQHALYWLLCRIDQKSILICCINQCFNITTTLACKNEGLNMSSLPCLVCQHQNTHILTIIYLKYWSMHILISNNDMHPYTSLVGLDVCAPRRPCQPRASKYLLPKWIKMPSTIMNRMKTRTQATIMPRSWPIPRPLSVSKRENVKNGKYWCV